MLNFGERIMLESKHRGSSHMPVALRRETQMWRIARGFFCRDNSGIADPYAWMAYGGSRG